MISTRLVKDLAGVARDALVALDTHPAAHKLIAGTMTHDEYDYYLAQAAHQISGTRALLEATAAGLSKLGRIGLAELFAAKAAEEDHDHWPKLDRDALVQPGDDVVFRPAAPAVVAYRAATWFMATNEPTSLLGVAYLLEMLGRERAAKAADNLVRNGAIPRVAGALRFLRGHGEADPHHVAALEHALLEIDDPVEAERVALAARLTAGLYLGFFQPAHTAAGA